MVVDIFISLSAQWMCGVPDEPRGRMGCYLIWAQVVGIVVIVKVVLSLFLSRLPAQTLCSFASLFRLCVGNDVIVL